ncbi:MAG: lactoylglutathione lyase [Clostridiales bacterium]|nr:lactoylglutathione lyase [Clostridiales bacterium]
MHNNIRYVHTNIIAKDWQKLSAFYIDVFNCEAVPPERNLSGAWVDQLTAIDRATIRGIHLKLPGTHDITLEIFEYTPKAVNEAPKLINRIGYGHLAFHVDDVKALAEKVLLNGGHMLGEIVEKDYGEIGILTAAYVSDPEGNFIEIQNWRKIS